MKGSVQQSAVDLVETFRLEEFLPYRLAVAADGVSRMIARQHLDPSGLGMPEWRLLAVVGRQGVISPTEAVDRTAMDKVKVSRAVASLVSRGLLRQSRDPEDGRGRRMRLTRKGTTVFAGIAPTGEKIEQALASGISASELTALRSVLLKLIDHTNNLLHQEAEAAPAGRSARSRTRD
jgi:DNA-binding MarR family transcriptional regulator